MQNVFYNIVYKQRGPLQKNQHVIFCLEEYMIPHEDSQYRLNSKTKSRNCCKLYTLNFTKNVATSILNP